MNEKWLDVEVFCTGCGKLIGSGYKYRKRKFCSNQCQLDHRAREAQKAWLTSGTLVGWTGGKTGVTPHANYVRNFLLEEQKHRCAVCTAEDIWMGQKLVFVLDHADGNYHNHQRENLRLICPNCDSQTPTFKGRNRGKGRRSLGFSTNIGL